MQNFTYLKSNTVDEALKSIAASGRAPRFVSGGTTLVDLMKLEVEKPDTLIDLNHLPLKKIEKVSGGGMKIGAEVKNSELAFNDDIKKSYAVLSQALLSGASPQLRNKATTAGNLLQRTRCVYFRDPSKPCNKREPKSGCGAIDGFNRNLAILGTSDSCIATNPSDMNVALLALGAKIQVQSSRGTREITIDDFHLLPGKTPERESALEKDEIITSVSLPALSIGTKSHYLKLRDRASYEFALSSAAIVLRMQGKQIAEIRMAMGGIATKPWRNPKAEQMLVGQVVSNDLFKKAAAVFIEGAKAQSQNAFKIELAQRCLVHALEEAVRV